MQAEIKSDQTSYLIGLIASAVYVLVLGYLSTREYVCSAVAGLDCPQSPFTLIHVILHLCLLGYLFVLYGKITSTLQWKWGYLCFVSIAFITIATLQYYLSVNAYLIYLAMCFSLGSFGALFFDNAINEKRIHLIKIAIAGTVLIGVLIFLRIAISI